MVMSVIGNAEVNGLIFYYLSAKFALRKSNFGREIIIKQWRDYHETVNILL